MSTPTRLSQLTSQVRRLLRQTHGQDLIEYGVLIAMITAVVILAVSQLGLKVPGLYEPTVAALPEGDSGGPGRGGNPGNGNPGNGSPVGNPGGNPGGRGAN